MVETHTPKVDLHVHYDTLKEKESVEKVIDMAESGGIIAIGLLARERVSSNFDSFILMGKQKGVDIVPGVEHFALINGSDVDLICLGFDPNHQEIQAYFGEEGERERNKKIASIQVDFLVQNGFNFDKIKEEDSYLFDLIVRGGVTEKAIYLCRILAKTNNNRHVLSRLKIENSELWQKVISTFSKREDYDKMYKLEAKMMYELLFAKDGPGFTYTLDRMGKDRGNIDDAIRAVHVAGGVVLYSPEGNYSDVVWDIIQEKGADGLMVWHGSKMGYDGKNTDVPTGVIIKARIDGKLVLGGSDYQGADWKSGEGMGDMFISKRRYEELMKYIKDRNKGELPWIKTSSNNK